jgi:hypothetical protein
MRKLVKKTRYGRVAVLTHLQQVPAGVAYTITWTPTTPETDLIELILLRGPSTNVKPIATLAAGIPNTGTYSWTPSTALEADVTHYGLQLIVESTGQYQCKTSACFHS